MLMVMAQQMYMMAIEQDAVTYAVADSIYI